MFCSKCGAELRQDAVFCANCGAPAANTVPATNPIPAAQPIAATQPVAPSAPTPPGRRKKRHRGLTALIVILCIAALGVGAYFVWGAQLGLAQKDLGVTWAQRDYQSFMTKVDVKTETPPTITDRSKVTKVFTGTKQIDWTLTSGEVTAWMNKNRPGYWPFSNVQVKFSDGNRIEASGMLDIGKFMKYPMVSANLPEEAVKYTSWIPIQIPVYMDFDASFPGPKTPDIRLKKVQVPFYEFDGGAWGGEPNSVVNRMVSDLLYVAEQVSITEFRTSNGQLVIKGTWFEEMKRIIGN